MGLLIYNASVLLFDLTSVIVVLDQNKLVPDLA